MPDRPCLYYHIGQCLAPCVKEVKEEQNKQIIENITRFLNGGYEHVKTELTEKMLKASEELDFERAKEYRDQIAHIEATMEKQK